MAAAVTHFEIYAEEPAKLADFYAALFSWQVEQIPGIAYWRVQTGAEPADGVGGGITHRPIPGPRSWVHYVHVASLDESIADLVRLGGTVVRPKSAVARTAWFAVVADPEGNIFALWQTDPAAMPTPVPD